MSKTAWDTRFLTEEDLKKTLEAFKQVNERLPWEFKIININKTSVCFINRDESKAVRFYTDSDGTHFFELDVDIKEIGFSSIVSENSLKECVKKFKNEFEEEVEKKFEEAQALKEFLDNELD